MQSRIKAGLVVGGVQFVFTVLAIVSGAFLLCCPICLPVLGLFTGAVAGWLAVEWSDHKPDYPLMDGIIAGGIASIGQFLGLLLPIGAFIALAQLPGFEELISVAPPADGSGIETPPSPVSLWLGILIGAVLVLGYFAVTGPGLGALAAYYRANVKPFPATSGARSQRDEEDIWDRSEWVERDGHIE